MDGEFSAVSTPDLVSEITTLAGHLNAANARFLALIAELDRQAGLGGVGREVLRALAQLEVRDRSGVGAGEGAGGVMRSRSCRASQPPMADGPDQLRESPRHDARGRCDERGLPAQHRALRNCEPCGGSRARLSPGDGRCGAVTRSGSATRPVALVPYGAGRITGDSRPVAGRDRRALRESASGRRGQSPNSEKRFRRKRLPTSCIVVRKRRVEALRHDGRDFLASGPQELVGRRSPADRSARGFETAEAQPLPVAASWNTGPSIAAETARRLSCDSSVVRIIEDEKGEPLNVGRKDPNYPACDHEGP